MARKKKTVPTTMPASQPAVVQRTAIALGGTTEPLESSEESTTDVDKASPSRSHLAAAFLLLALPWIAYVPLWQAGFIWDDDAYVTENIQLRTGQGLYSIWFVPRSIPQYYPLVHTMFWFEYQTWGLHPLGYHLVNVGLHAISGVLLWRILLRLKVPGAWLAAAFFVVHPVMVESVAWVTERKNVLSLPLALASMIFYWRYRPSLLENRRQLIPETMGSTWYYAVSLLLFVGALLSKTVVCTLPAVLLVIEWWKQGRIERRSVLLLLPYFAVGISLGLLTVWLEKHHVGAQGAEWSLSILDRILLAGRIVWFYAGKLVWPEPLIFFYPRWQIDSSQAWQYIYPAAAVAVVVALWAGRKTIGRGPVSAVLIFIGVLFPALGFFDVYPFRYSFVADHFQYHASIALVALGASILYRSAVNLKVLSQRQNAWFLNAMAAVAIVILTNLTFHQSHAYKDLESIYRDTLGKNPAAWGATSNLADHYLSLGSFDEALAVAEQGLVASAEVASTHNTMGAVLLQKTLAGAVEASVVEESIGYFQKTLQIEPNYHEALFNLATALSLLERHEEAVKYYRSHLEIIPSDLEAQSGLARSLIITGQMEQALPMLESVLRVKPDDATALHGMGLIDAQHGRLEEAIANYRAALRSDDNLVGVRFDLAGALMTIGDLAQARDQYLIVVQRQPWNIRARNNLGVVYMNLSEPQKAIEQFSKAVDLAPDYQQAKENLERARQSIVNP